MEESSLSRPHAQFPTQSQDLSSLLLATCPNLSCSPPPWGLLRLLPSAPVSDSRTSYPGHLLNTSVPPASASLPKLYPHPRIHSPPLPTLPSTFIQIPDQMPHLHGNLSQFPQPELTLHFSTLSLQSTLLWGSACNGPSTVSNPVSTTC